MNPVAALVLPASAVLLAAGAVSAAPDDGARPATRAVSETTTAQSGDQPSARALPDVSRSASPGLRGRWEWPLRPQPVVARPFLQPASKYGAGHRGVDLVGVAGQDVLAVEAGTVTHVGRIAGRGTIAVLHASGIRSTYEPVVSALTTGAVVAGGDRLGRLEPSGSHCGAEPCLHLGAIRDEAYLDPLVFILGGRRVRLLPVGQVPEG